ncbi:3-oxoacyl-[acyl-carrier-protein] synthase I, chloroplastic [Lolium rigidum]|uniref:3-oxoacyl-[acyl-carrier-protein] synthase I, chloroplastic n=1 Tax=Lolium rigidum TaxID=89674 RepID=UPI001F5E2B62|nr:3-oxoacyl-[acyl-carrier-protein] synthase I, chloroplastic [Lolium rigidum]
MHSTLKSKVQQSNPLPRASTFRCNKGKKYIFDFLPFPIQSTKNASLQIQKSIHPSAVCRAPPRHRHPRRLSGLHRRAAPRLFNYLTRSPDRGSPTASSAMHANAPHTLGLHVPPPAFPRRRERLRRRSAAAVRAAVATSAAPQRETDPRKRVVITGMGLASVFGNEVDAFYDRLLAGESGVGTIDRFDPGSFPTRFAGQIRGFSSEGYIDGKNDRRLDDCIRYCILSGKKALESAGLGTGSDAHGKLDVGKAGVLVGTGMGGLTAFSDAIQNLTEKGYKRISPFFIPYSITNMGSALLAMDVGFMGPNYSISTACATSNFCFYAAANHIRRGDADIIVAGGTEAAILPIGLGGFVACRALSQRNDDPATASRPWDTGRDGFVMGEGAGVLVMESLEHAMKRGAPIVAEYLGGAVNCDAYHLTDPRSDGMGVSSCITKSLQDAGVAPEEVNYINAHATSTLAGDLAEVRAIKQVFKNTSEIKINSTKSMIGHCLGAAGGLEAIATIKSITTGWVHPTINQFNPEPEVNFDTVANEKKQHEVNVAISNSFGFGGHNSVVVFAPFKL